MSEIGMFLIGFLIPSAFIAGIAVDIYVEKNVRLNKKDCPYRHTDDDYENY